MLISLLVLFIIVTIIELPNLIVYGPLINMDNKMDITNYTLNPFDSRIINDYSEPTGRDRPYVTLIKTSLFFSYHIDGRGLVPRYCKLHFKIADRFKTCINRLLIQNIELIAEVEKLRHLLHISNGTTNRRNGNNIDTGIGQISYSVGGSIDVQELMNELEKCIKNNGVRNTISILAHTN